ncbi:MAG TPA: (Fe-S)-binding protein [Tahibacter sp.]|nr:(Fe-S)-binding protein [Tahibacter sp.]
MPVHTSASVDLAALADQCVMCGLCLPHCPTYRVERVESESPRGRIALAKAVANGSLPPSPAVQSHLDHCLSCLSCEAVCPSKVRYGEIIVAARAAHPPARRAPMLAWLAHRPRLLRSLARFGAAVHAPRWLPRVLGRATALGRIAAELPRVPPTPTLPPLPQSTSRARIGLFLGCVASAFDRDTHAAAAHLLSALGYEVVVPSQSHCCGALARHTGDLADAQRVSAPTRTAFADVDTVIVTASGCFGSLRDHALAGSGVRVREIHEFLATDTAFDALRFRALDRRVAVHVPCSIANVAKSGRAMTALLRRIPALRLDALPEQPRCCGAAGSYFLEHARIADALRAERVEQIDALAPDLVVTANIGCRAFLDNALHRGPHAPRVVHPVTLLAEQLAP